MSNPPDETPDSAPIDGPLSLSEKDFTECVMGAGVLLRQWQSSRGAPMQVGELMAEVGECLNNLIAVRHLSVGEAKNILMLAAALGLKGEQGMGL